MQMMCIYVFASVSVFVQEVCTVVFTHITSYIYNIWYIMVHMYIYIYTLYISVCLYAKCVMPLVNLNSNASSIVI